MVLWSMDAALQEKSCNFGTRRVLSLPSDVHYLEVGITLELFFSCLTASMGFVLAYSCCRVRCLSCILFHGV